MIRRGRLRPPPRTLAEAGAGLILVEPFLLPIHGVVEAGDDLDPKIQTVRRLARRYGAQLLAADGRFAELAVSSAPEHWSADGVRPNPAGHAALAAAWPRLVA
ncbi:hypothetical protein [Kitasatospora sp. NPDC096204]|uniref:hypothetical protein n=1 Tax=Kitasatospora sp. NPDC096204 TaxID=3364094 RepID=UPI00380C12F3